MKHIGIMGAAGSGKDFVADLLGKAVQSKRTTHYKVCLADPLKRMVMTTWPEITEEILWGPSELRSTLVTLHDGTILNPRVLLQELATDFARKHHPNVWVDQLFRVMHKIDQGYDYHRVVGPYYPVSHEEDLPYREVIIFTPDVRFPNEVKAFRKKGGFVLGLINPEETTEKKASWACHESETSLDFSLVDHTVINDKSKGVEALEASLAPVLAYLNKL